MRRRSIALTVAVVVSSAAPAQATLHPFTTALLIQLATLPPIALPGSGVATLNGSGGGAHLNTLALPASPFAITGLVVPVTDPAAAPIRGVELTAHNGPGSGSPSDFVMPLGGVAKVCLFAACTAAPPANLIVPLNGLGAGGAATVGTLVNITAIGAPWTAGTAAVGTVSIAGFRHGPGSLTSSTASGQIRLVTPVFISTNIGASAVVPAFGILDFDFFVPEPRTLALLGGGTAWLALLGRARKGAEPGAPRSR